MMTTIWTEQTKHRAALIRIAVLEEDLRVKTMELKCVRNLQIALSKTLHVIRKPAGVSTEHVVKMVRDFYDGEVE